MTRELHPNKAYAHFSDSFEEIVSSKLFTEPKLKIFTLQTAGGKSYYQDKEMPLKLKNAFPEMKYIFRLSPTTEVAYDGTFVNVDQLNTSECSFSFVADPPSTSIVEAFGKLSNIVLCVSCTHTYFTVHFDRLLKYAPQSVLIIEEAHQFIGCADPGSEAYVVNFGYGSEYTAQTWQKIAQWKEVNPRVLGFTATPTEHHKGNTSLTDQFTICGELAPLEDIIPSQSWMNPPKPYSFTKHNGADSIESAVHQSIDTLFDRESQLNDLKYFSYINEEQLLSTYYRSDKDTRINTKLSALYVCGDQRGVWGCPIDQVREVISKYLLGDCGYEESDKMIATMVEDSSGGNAVWTLGGTSERINSSEDLFKKLHDEHDPLRFLLVINRGRSGINVHNLTAGVICRIRDPKEVKTPIPIQIFGRLVRLNPGTGDIIRKEYMNNLDNYLQYYSEDYNVDIKTIIKTIKIANVFDIWHPTNGKAKRTWEESLDEFEECYVNTSKKGYDYLYKFSGLENPICAEMPIDNEISLNCPFCGESIEKKIGEWATSGSLDKFFI